jgi:hypothetical protein
VRRVKSTLPKQILAQVHIGRRIEKKRWLKNTHIEKVFKKKRYKTYQQVEAVTMQACYAPLNV